MQGRGRSFIAAGRRAFWSTCSFPMLIPRADNIWISCLVTDWANVHMLNEKATWPVLIHVFLLCFFVLFCFFYLRPRSMELSSRTQPHSRLAVARKRRLHADAEKSKHFLCGLQMPHWFLTVTREYSEIGPAVTFKDKANSSKQPRLIQPITIDTN